MLKNIDERVKSVALAFLDTRQTIRQLANVFNVSKSTIHKDLRERLIKVEPSLQDEVSSLLEYHKTIRNIKGGESTKLKWAIIKKGVGVNEKKVDH